MDFVVGISDKTIGVHDGCTVDDTAFHLDVDTIGNSDVDTVVVIVVAFTGKLFRYLLLDSCSLYHSRIFFTDNSLFV